ncbi:MAG: electron transfer flavoprotein subunit alpha/FixB family protein [Pirellulales bacterium]
MQTLVIAEHDGTSLRAGSLHALDFARRMAGEGEEPGWLVVGASVGEVAREAARYAPTLVADAPQLGVPTADRYARVIADVAQAEGCQRLLAVSSSFAKDILPRACVLLGGAMASDVVGFAERDDHLVFERPMYAGAVIASVRLLGAPMVITVRSTACAAAETAAALRTITPIAIEGAFLPEGIVVQHRDRRATHRPDVTEARVVISGGRAVKSSDDFERLVGGLADQFGGAVGSSRALVDAGITPNELQVGQTGKIVNPELYFALGISGAVQHLAGMKNSKTIVAINTDPDAPIFDVADYGLVGDIYEIVPQLIEQLDAQRHA